MYSLLGPSAGKVGGVVETTAPFGASEFKFARFEKVPLRQFARPATQSVKVTKMPNINMVRREIFFSSAGCSCFVEATLLNFSLIFRDLFDFCELLAIILTDS